MTPRLLSLLLRHYNVVIVRWRIRGSSSERPVRGCPELRTDAGKGHGVESPLAGIADQGASGAGNAARGAIQLHRGTEAGRIHVRLGLVLGDEHPPDVDG